MTDTAAFNTEQFLAHHGVLGQKWGVRNDPDGTQHKMSGKEKDDEILAARSRQAGRLGKLNSKAALTYTQTTQRGQEAANKAYDKYAKTVMEHPDNITANRMTRGEKAATGVYLGVFGAAAGALLFSAIKAKY